MRRRGGEALAHTQPEIFNSDQGSQFTASAFTSCLEAKGGSISMDGRGRALDNVFVERIWRKVYLKDYQNAWEAEHSLAVYLNSDCHQRNSHISRSIEGITAGSALDAG